MKANEHVWQHLEDTELIRKNLKKGRVCVLENAKEDQSVNDIGRGRFSTAQYYGHTYFRQNYSTHTELLYTVYTEQYEKYSPYSTYRLYR